jgi:hypothetical protein
MKPGDTIALIANFGSGNFYRQYFWVDRPIKDRHFFPSNSMAIWVLQKFNLRASYIYHHEIRYMVNCKMILSEKIIK